MSLSKILTPLLHSAIAARLVTMVVVSAVVLVAILVLVLFLILMLRKLLGWIQTRIGPNRVGPWGLLQTVCDALKLFGKEDIIPTLADKWVYILAPIMVFVPAYMVYVVIPFSEGRNGIVKDLNIGLLYIAAVTSVGVIGTIIGAWASNNKYSLLGAFRSAAQLVGYEVPQVLAMLGSAMLVGSLRMQEIVNGQHVWFILLQPIGFLIYLTAALAENNLTPFDLVEAESELVSGFNTEYSGMKFAFFFLAEFAHNFTISAIAVTLFLGGWRGPILIPGTSPWVWGLGWFMVKTIGIVAVTMWIRGTLPRVRVDQLMEMAWKVLIPAALVNMLLIGFVVAMGWPHWVLAAINFGILGALLALGATWQALRGRVRARTENSKAQVA